MTNNILPLVSVIITSFNHKKVFERAYNSVLNQTYKNIEIIVVDDCSTDGSQQIIKEVISRRGGNAFFFQHEKNAGVASSRNTGFKNANGELLTYLDSDDYYYPDKIKGEVETLTKNPAVDVVYSNFLILNEITNEQSIWNKKRKNNLPIGNVFKELLFDEFPRHIDYRCELMKSFVLDKIGFYDTDLKRYSDYDVRLRYSVDHQVAYCNQVGSVYIRNAESISIKNTSDYELFLDCARVKNKNKWLIEKLKNVNAAHLMKSLEKKIDLNLLFLSNKNTVFSLVQALKFFVKYPGEFKSFSKYIKWRITH